MSDFDPYLKWLGIRDAQRPPNHYRLLGIELFEDDKEVITAAADRQSDFVRSFQESEHHDDSSKILGELAEARRCLMDRPSKLAYDEWLHSSPFDAPKAVEAFPTITSSSIPVARRDRNKTNDRWRSDGVASETIAPRIHTRPKRNNKHRVWITLLSWVSGGVAAVLVGGWIVNSGVLDRIRGDQVATPTEPIRSDSKIAATSKRKPHPPKLPIDLPSEQPQPPTASEHKLNPGIPGNAENLGPLPWDENRFPPIPAHLLKPESEIDSLLQATWVAIGVRDLERAGKEWKNVYARVQAIERTRQVGRKISNMRKFWAFAMNRIQHLGPGDTIDFRGTQLQVFRATAKGIWLRTLSDDNATMYFPIDKENVDRDLIHAVAKINPPFNPKKTRQYLELDFAHERSRLEPFLTTPLSVAAAPNRADNTIVRPETNTPKNVAPLVTTMKSRKPVPDNPSIVESRRNVKKLFPDGYSKTNSIADRHKVAKDMIAQAANSSDKPVQVFALLTEAINVAQAIGEGPTGIKALDNLNSEFQIDYWDLAQSFVLATSKNAETLNQKNNMNLAFRTLVVRALQEKNYAAAKFLANKATTITEDINSPTDHQKAILLRNETKEIARIADRAKQGLKTLETDPENGRANSEVGGFLCLVENDFENGLMHWAKSSKPEEQIIASLEEKFRGGVVENLESQLGNAWSDLGEDKNSFRDARCLARARHWKQLALAKANGLSRKKLETEITDISKLLEQLPSAIATRELGR